MDADAAEADPFHSIKAEIEAELQHITTLQARLFSGHGEVAGALNTRLAAAAEQLSALETAVQSMVTAPTTYGLSPAAAFGRQVEVETLRYTLTDLQETCAQAETSKGAATGNQSSSIELPTIQPPGAVISRPDSRPNGNSFPTTSSSSKQPSGGGGTSNSSQQHPRLPAGPPIRHSKLVQSRGHQPLKQSSGSSNGGGGGSGQRSKHPAGASTSGGTGLHTANNASSGSHQGEDDTRGGWGGDANGGDVSYESMMQQQMRQQDEALDHISIHVDRIKHTGLLMHDELEEQAGLLSGLQEDTDTTHMRLRAARKKVSDVIKQASKDRQLCLILVLSVVLVVLTVLAIA